MTAHWRIASPTGAPGAVAIIEIAAPAAPELDVALAALRISLPPGAMALRPLFAIDRAVCLRPSPTLAILMPHGGGQITRDLAAAFAAHLGPSCDALPPSVAWPEAADDVEAHMLAALAHAPSPLAIDLLLDQPRRWREHRAGLLPPPCAELDAALRPLLASPLVVALGPANIGKSTLLNALAGRTISITSDQPGTTRDHVGVSLDLAGLTVRYVDTPGLRDHPDPAEAAARDLALALLPAASLVIHCVDAAAPAPAIAWPASAAPVLRVGLRADLAPASILAPSCDQLTSAARGEGLAELATKIRARLLPQAALDDPRPWCFWDAISPGCSSASA